MHWQGRRVLVTGAGGFIGSHLVERLVELGADVRALVRYNSRGDRGMLETASKETLDRVEVVPGDVTDPGAADAAVEGREVVFHLAALIAIPHSYRAPRSYIDANVVGTHNLLEAARRHGVARFVHTSTSEVYGTARTDAIDETHPLNAQSPYAASKVAADQLVLSYACSFEIPAVVVRPFNTYGPRQSARAIIPAIACQALDSDVVRLGALDPQRDMTFVADTVEGFIAAAGAEGVLGEVLNLGTGRCVSIGDLAAMVIAAAGGKARVEQDPGRLRPPKSEVLRLRSDPSKALRLAGWSAKVGMEEGIRRTVEWIRGHRDRYRPGEYAR